MRTTKAELGIKLQEADEALKLWMREAADLRAALDQHAIVAITDPQGRITFANNKFCAISKYSLEELTGQDHRIINSGYHTKEFIGDLWLTITRGSVWHGEIKNRGRDGSHYWVATTIVPFLGEDGQPHQFVAIGSDITKQKEVEAELAGKLRLQGLLAELSSHFVAEPSDRVDATIEFCQRRIVETFDLDRSTLWQLFDGKMGMVLTHSWQREGFVSLPPRFDVEGMLPWMHEKLIAGELVRFDSLSQLPPEAARDVETFQVYGPKSNVTIPLVTSGRVFGALAFASLGSERNWSDEEIAEFKLVAQIIGNVVARQRAEIREEQLRDQLAHAMRVATLGELSAALAHELNQPLAAILCNAQAALRFIAEGEIKGDELQAILDDIVRDDKRAGSVIRNLHEMVRKRPTIRETCTLNELVLEVLDLMRGEVISEKINIRSSLAPGSSLVRVVRVELQQVLVNLLINAVHAMKDTALGSRIIEVETHAGSESVTISIRDHGSGIPSDRLTHVFDPFFSTKANGLGMGLSISRRIIENHSGHIDARNNDDGGATFSFSLPTVKSG